MSSTRQNSSQYFCCLSHCMSRSTQIGQLIYFVVPDPDRNPEFCLRNKQPPPMRVLRGTKTFLDPRILSTKYTECSMCVLCGINRPDVLLAYAVGTIAGICDLRRLQLGRCGELIRRALLAPGCCLLSMKYTSSRVPCIRWQGFDTVFSEGR